MRLEVVSKVSRLLDKIKENRAVKDATEGILQEEKKKEEVKQPVAVTYMFIDTKASKN